MTQRHEDSDDDTYVTIGAAFERLETDEDVQKEKHKKEKEQYVTDSKGRRRFHGAFTGGFSAGYFNTVGSEEGWTPSSFVSSRDKKSSFSHQKPEDFMDEEDLGAYGIAPRAITAKEEYDQQKPGSKRSAESAQPGVIPGVHPLQNLIVPTKSSVGARLLKAMGWREGEGVGPKKMKYVPPQKASGKEEVYSRDHSETADDTENMPPPGRHFKAAEGFMFAPKDVTPWQFEAKDDMHGIGYRGIQDMGVLSTQQSTKSLYGMSGAAFGIGALEEEEEVDNVYAVESMISYDNTLAGEGDISTERKYGWTGGHESDWGLSSFSIASNQTNKAKRYPPPQVPRDFVPVHNFGNTAAASSAGTAGNHHHKPLTSAVRTQMLSDAPGSVFSLLSAADRDRLKRVTVQAREKGTSDSYISPPATLESKQAKSSSVVSPKGNQAKNLSAERLKPFVRDPDKQARYEAFLAGKQPEKPSSEYGMTEWERQKEREEFAKTARIFQPLSTTLASRFRRSEDAVKDKKEMESEPMSPESDAIQAAKANMFGVLTREIEEWHPHRILCKRFNVPDPYPGSGVVGVSKGNEVRYSNTIASSATKRSIDFLHTERLIPVEQPNEQETELTEESPANLTSEVQNVELQSSTTIPTNTDDVGEDTKRPPMDLFKSIFAESSSESEASSSEPDMDTDHKQPRHTASSHSSATTHIDQQKSRWQDLSVVTTKLPAITTTVSKQSDSSHKSDFPKPVHNAPVFMSTQHHIPSTLDKHSLDAHSTQQRSEIQQSPSKVEVVIRKEERISQIQDYGPPLPPDFGAAEDLSKHGNSSTRRQSDSSKHKRKHSKKSHRKEGTSEHHKKRKHSRHK